MSQQPAGISCCALRETPEKTIGPNSIVKQSGGAHGTSFASWARTFFAGRLGNRVVRDAIPDENAENGKAGF